MVVLMSCQDRNVDWDVGIAGFYVLCVFFLLIVWHPFKNR